MELESSSETLVLIYHTRRHHISKSTVICQAFKTSNPKVFARERDREKEREKELYFRPLTTYELVLSRRWD